MLLLIDENVPESVAEFFRLRGHDVRYVRDELAAGAPDALIAASADAVGAVLVTWNRKHFKKYAHGLTRRYPRLGLICFSCPEPQGRARLERAIELIEWHYARRTGDEAFFVEVGRTGVRVEG